jgi:hypothetical protein
MNPMTESTAREPSVKASRRMSVRRIATCAGASIGALILAVVVFFLVFSGPILNGYGKSKAERAFAKSHPGSELRLGELQYSLSANCLVAQSLSLIATNAKLKVGRISLSGVHWSSLLWGSAALADVLAKASLEATNLNLEFPQARYGVRCAWLRASVPNSELIADGTELRTLVGDEEFFAAHAFRTTRFHAVMPECNVSGLAYGELLQGKSYRARSIQVSWPTLEVLINRDKPVDPSAKPPLMVHEALAAIPQPLQVDSLSVTNGCLKYCERLVVGADPGVLTISAANLLAEGIANHGATSAAIQIRAQAELMGTGAMKVLMSIPITPPDFSMHYSGSLGAMDMTRLNAFLETAEHTRIKSGNVQEATFDVDVTAGVASGHVWAIYKNLELAVLDKRTGTEDGLDNRLDSLLAKLLKIRSSNAQYGSGSIKGGEVAYTKRPAEEFQQFAWFALRTGVLDIITH